MTTILNHPECPDDTPWNIDLEEIARLAKAYPKLARLRLRPTRHVLLRPIDR